MFRVRGGINHLRIAHGPCDKRAHRRFSRFRSQARVPATDVRYDPGSSILPSTERLVLAALIHAGVWHLKSSDSGKCRRILICISSRVSKFRCEL
jgi:hypothetical protein